MGNTENGVGCRQARPGRPLVSRNPGEHPSCLSHPKPETEGKKKPTWAGHQSFQWVPSWIATIHINVLVLGRLWWGTSRYRRLSQSNWNWQWSPHAKYRYLGLKLDKLNRKTQKGDMDSTDQQEKKKEDPEYKRNPKEKLDLFPNWLDGESMSCTHDGAIDRSQAEAEAS